MPGAKLGDGAGEDIAVDDGTSSRALGTPARERVLRTRGRQTMGRLLDAGRDVVARQGHQAARIDDIVQEAAVSHGTFYLYFTDKDDLLRALAEECVEEVVELAVGLGPVEPGEAGFREVRAWVARFFETYERWGAVIRVFMERRHIDRRLAARGTEAFTSIRRSLQTRLAEASGPSSGRDDPSTALAAAAMLAMVERYAYLVVARGIPLDTDRLLDTVARMVHRGFFGGR